MPAIATSTATTTPAAPTPRRRRYFLSTRSASPDGDGVRHQRLQSPRDGLLFGCAHFRVSSMSADTSGERRRWASPRAAWLFTVPGEMPSTSATPDSAMSS